MIIVYVQNVLFPVNNDFSCVCVIENFVARFTFIPSFVILISTGEIIELQNRYCVAFYALKNISTYSSSVLDTLLLQCLIDKTNPFGAVKHLSHIHGSHPGSSRILIRGPPACNTTILSQCRCEYVAN